MIRARFFVKSDDYRPVNWPIDHPYWLSAQGEDFFILVAYAEDLEEIWINWPDSYNVESEEVAGYVFTERFPCPDWFKNDKYISL